MPYAKLTPEKRRERSLYKPGKREKGLKFSA
jgi:hypothetical protein